MLKENHDNVLFEIEDSGPGIPLSNLEKIFDPSIYNKTNWNGSWSCTSVKSIIEMHQGTISVTSPPTIFTIILPKS